MPTIYSHDGDESMTIYASAADYIDQVVRPSLDEYVDDYDLQEIASEMLEWHEEIDEEGKIHLNHSGLIERDGVDFWEVAAKHEKATK